MNEIENSARTDSFWVPESAITDEDGQPVELAELMNPPIRAKPKVGRNAQCPCGSGRKFKKCCIKTPTTSTHGQAANDDTPQAPERD